ncbi:MAG: response regulator [Mediterranea sp.]|nr:response regulator [Mediterranea sp.]
MAEGLSQVSVMSVYQDGLGAMWLGTSEGLCRYNGNDMRVFRASPDSEGLTNDEITNLCGNKRGQIYIQAGSDLVKLNIDKEEFTCLRRKDVLGIYCQADTLWVSCRQGDIYYYTEQSGQFTPFARLRSDLGSGGPLYVDDDTLWVATFCGLVAVSRKEPGRQEKLLSFYRGRCVTKDKAGNLWIGSWGGLYRLSPRREIVHYTAREEEGEFANLSDNQVRCVREDNEGHIWVGTFRGLDRYNPYTNEWTSNDRYGDSPNTLSHNSILALYKDTQGNLWAGTYYGGVNVFTPDDDKLQMYYAEPLRKGSLSFPVVGRMTKDGVGNIWICTEGGGLNCFTPDNERFTSLTHESNNPESIGSDNCKCVYYRKENNSLYVGTHLGGLFVLNLTTRKSHTLRHEEGNDASIPHDIVNDIQGYKNGMALLTQGGPVYFDPVTETCSPLTADTVMRSVLRRGFAYETFLIDSHQRMWLSRPEGGVVRLDFLSSRLDRFEAAFGDTTCIGRAKVLSMVESTKGDIYFCTRGSGLIEYDDRTKEFQAYNTANRALPSDYCYAACRSNDDQKLYLLHGEGFSLFDTEAGTVVYTTHLHDQVYNPTSTLYRDGVGNLYVGGGNGLAVVREASLRASVSAEGLAFDKLLVLNKEVRVGDGSGLLTDILARTSDIYLTSKQNNVTVEFSDFNYSGNRPDLFEYKLEGYDPLWTQTSNLSITYTKLPTGDYTLRLRRVGDENDHGTASLNIHVAAPFYATTWAYLLYALVLGTLVIGFVLIRRRQEKLRAYLIAEREEKERLEQESRSKQIFFTNISHEFRTPLTLIIGQLESLMHSAKLEPHVQNRVTRVYRNAWQMRELVGELLTFRKQQDGYMKLSVEEVDLVPFIHQLCVNFQELARQKGIGFHFHSEVDTLLAWIDTGYVRKVVFNLLSNAFKFTPAGGDVTIHVRQTSTQAIVRVSDTGAGISAEDREHVFDPFYQADNQRAATADGFGIGLAFSKGIMDLHHGSIGVESVVGEGSTFTLAFVLGNGHFSPEELSKRPKNVLIPEAPKFFDGEVVEAEEIPSTPFGDEGESGERSVVLLVDDNEDILLVLSDLLGGRYKIYTATNGEEALAKAGELQPDLMICDVMMPGMSGKELCYKIKASVELSHILVVLLTAQSNTEQVVEGLLFGADAYISKPFSSKILLARCDSLIKNKKRLLAYYAGKPMIDDQVNAVAANEADQRFMERCDDIIRKNFADTSFNVSSLAERMFTSKSKLYTLFKQISGLTPNEYILKLKMNEGMRFLAEHPEWSIAEISTKLGFSSPRYFSASFKMFFGTTPAGVKKKGRKTTSN